MRKRKALPKPLLELRKRLNSREEAVREQAYQEALALPAETLLLLATSEAKRAHNGMKMQGVTGGSCCVWLLAGISTIVAQFALHTAFVAWDALLCLWLVLSIGTPIKVESRSRLYSLYSRMILAQTDARFVAPALLFYLNMDSREYPDLYKDLRQTLMRQMPLLTPAELEAWTPAHKTALRQHAYGNGNDIGRWYDLEMMCCVLQTLARVGTIEDIPAARKLANLTPEQIHANIEPSAHNYDRKELFEAIIASTVVAPHEWGQWEAESQAVKQDARYKQWCWERAQEIHALANQCFAALTERTGQQQQSEVLLRASLETTANQAQILLRPQYTTQSETPPEELLRAKVEG